MALLQILQVGDERLRQISQPVTSFDLNLSNLLNDMKETLIKAKGAGLAAPQVGVLSRVFVVNVEEGYFEFINPVILGVSGSQYGVEGCLSVKGKWGDVKRPKKVTVKAQDRFGKWFKIVAKDFFAKAICHEYDHLDGKLYIDIADNLRDEDAEE
ncbi:MAG: peptide deformylase [Clostridia bacterium]|nr:peptide deformylase [Clostridia bacterium]